MSIHQDKPISAIHRDLVRRIVSGDGKAPPKDRLRAFNGVEFPEPYGKLLTSVAAGAGHVTDNDIERAKSTGATEDQIFELVVCAAVGAATRQYEAGLTALDRVRSHQQDK